MKKTPLVFALLLLAITSSSWGYISSADKLQIFSSASSTSTSNFNSHIEDVSRVTTSVVTANEYCDFLNRVAASNSQYLYNEAMGSDPITASIARVGAPGRWHYEVIAGRENFLINYVNRQQAGASFAGRLQATGYRLQEEANDDYVSCNGETFEVEVASTMLTLAFSSFPPPTSNDNTYIADAVSAAALLGLLAAPELMMRRFGFGTSAEEASISAQAANENSALDAAVDHDSDGSDNESIRSSLSSIASNDSLRTTASTGGRALYSMHLSDFTEAALDHPMAGRLVIDHEETGMIISNNGVARDLLKNNRENKLIKLVLKDALRKEEDYKGFVSKLISKPIAGMYSSLSSAKIFQYINEVEERITKSLRNTKESNIDSLATLEERQAAISKKIEALLPHVERKKGILKKIHRFYEAHQEELENRDQQKTVLERGKPVVGLAANAAGNAHFMGLPVGVMAAGAYEVGVVLHQGSKNKSMKLAAKLKNEAEADLKKIEERIKTLEKQIKKERSVNFGEPTIFPDSPNSEDKVDTKSNEAEEEARAAWANAIEKESKAYEAISLTNNLKNAMGACRAASLAWKSAESAKAKHLSQATNDRDSTALSADAETAANKVKEWQERLEQLRNQHSTGAPLSSVDSSHKTADPETKAASNSIILSTDTSAKDFDKQQIKEAAQKLEIAGTQISNLQATIQTTRAQVREERNRLGRRRVDAIKAQKKNDLKAMHANQVAMNANQVAKSRIKVAKWSLFSAGLVGSSLLSPWGPLPGWINQAPIMPSPVMIPTETGKFLERTLALDPAWNESISRGNPFYCWGRESDDRKDWESCLTEEQVQQALGLRAMLEKEQQTAIKTMQQRLRHTATQEQIAQLKLDAASDVENGDQASSNNKSDQAISWNHAGNAKRHAIEELSGAIKAEEAGKIAERAAWRRIAEQRLLASTEFQQAARALGRETPEREEEAKNAWKRACDNMRKAIQEARHIQLMREEEAIIASHLPEAEKWREVITANEKADQYYTQAIEALVSEKIENAHDFYGAGNGLDWASYRLAKAIEARAVGTPEKLEEATRWEEAARENQKQSEYHLNAIQTRAEEKPEDATSWGNAAAYASRASDCIAKTIEAQAIGTPEKLQKAVLLEKGARESQKMNEYSRNAIQVRAEGKEEDAESWTQARYGAQWASSAFRSAAELIKPQAIETPEKLQEVIRWEKAARESQKRSEYHLNVIQARAVGKEDDVKSWTNAASGALGAYNRLIKAIKARAVGTPEKLQEATRREEAAREYQKQSEYHLNAVQARAVGTPEKLEEATRWEEAAREYQKKREYTLNATQARAKGRAEDATSWDNAAAGASRASDCIAKAIEARAIGTPEKLEEATHSEEAARESQKQSEYYLKAIEARASGKDDDAKSWEEAGDGASWASYLVKAIEAREIGTPEKLAEAIFWEEIARESQKQSEYNLKAIEAKALGKDDDAASWSNAATGAYFASDLLEDAIEARAIGTPEKLAEATRREEAARENQKESEYHLKAIEARALGKNEDATSWDNAGYGAHWASFLSEDAIKARAIGTPEKLAEATLWEKAARESQKRSEYNLKAIEARALGKDDDATSWTNAGYGAKWLSFLLEDAIKARAIGTPEKLAEAIRWEEAAALNRQACEHWIKAIQERAIGNQNGPTGGEYWDKEAQKKSDEAKKV